MCTRRIPVKLLAHLLVFVCAVSAFAQDQPCSVKLSDLPDSSELFGFRMGMTRAQLKLRVPQIVFGRVDEFGVSKTSISPDFHPQIDRASLSGIRTVSFDFLDDRLTSLWFGYDSSFKWKTVPDFVSGISQSLNLPDSWKTGRVRGQQLNCADFQMTVSIVAEGPSFHIIDKTAQETLAARREMKEEQEAASEAAKSSEIVADSKARVYYSEGCAPTTIADKDRVVFKTPEDAAKAGYKLAKNCQ